MNACAAPRTDTGTPTEPFALRGRRVGLRPVWPHDLPLVYSWWTDKDQAPFWTSQYRHVTTYDQFLPLVEAWLRDGATFMLVDLASGARFGFARTYNLNLADGWVWWQVYVEEAHRRRGVMGEWAALFSRYIFEQFPVRKLCGEIFAFNDGIVKLHEKLGFEYAPAVVIRGPGPEIHIVEGRITTQIQGDLSDVNELIKMVQSFR